LGGPCARLTSDIPTCSARASDTDEMLATPTSHRTTELQVSRQVVSAVLAIFFSAMLRDAPPQTHHTDHTSMPLVQSAFAAALSTLAHLVARTIIYRRCQSQSHLKNVPPPGEAAGVRSPLRRKAVCRLRLVHTVTVTVTSPHLRENGPAI
jgi:hypothetical protein